MFSRRRMCRSCVSYKSQRNAETYKQMKTRNKFGLQVGIGKIIILWNWIIEKKTYNLFIKQNG